MLSGGIDDVVYDLVKNERSIRVVFEWGAALPPPTKNDRRC